MYYVTFGFCYFHNANIGEKASRGQEGKGKQNSAWRMKGAVELKDH